MLNYHVKIGLVPIRRDEFRAPVFSTGNTRKIARKP